MRIQLWLRLNLNIKSSAEPCLWERALSACKDQSWGSWLNVGVLGERHEAQGGAHLSPELMPGKVGLVWKWSWSISRGFWWSCWNPGSSSSALAERARRHLQKERNAHPRGWFAFSLGQQEEVKGEVEQRRTMEWGVTWAWLWVWEQLIDTDPAELQSCPLILPLRPFLVPISSLDKELQIAFLRLSCVPGGPSTRPADGIQQRVCAFSNPDLIWCHI